MGGPEGFRTLLREIVLAVGMISILVVALWAHTGSMPPLVVVESNSMQHDPTGEVGTIDAGDLVLVHSPEKRSVITFADASNPDSINYGHESLGMAGDVIIFERNGEKDSTPIIHRALFEIRIETSVEAVESRCTEGTFWMDICILTWTVPGTNQENVDKINILFDGNDAGKYRCGGIAAQHGKTWFTVENYTPSNPGFITLGDNNDCNDDQSVFEFAQGLSSIHSGIIRPVEDRWVIGISGAELPWLGTVKLFVSGGSSPGVSQVPGSSFMFLIMIVGGIIAIPMLVDPLFTRVLKNSPEIVEANKEDLNSKIYSSEEE